MTTREEIEAALKRLRTIIDADDKQGTAYGTAWRTDPQVQIDSATVVFSFLAERAERQRRIEAATAEIRDAIDVFPGDEDKIRDIITRHLEETT